MNVKKCRPFIDAQKQFLAASPDGSIGNEAVAEVKMFLTSQRCSNRKLKIKL
jgi:hypothetical protein